MDAEISMDVAMLRLLYGFRSMDCCYVAIAIWILVLWIMLC